MDEAVSELKPRRIELLGVPVDAVDMQESIQHVSTLLAGSETSIVLAVNPEKVMAARREPKMLSILHDASLLVPDGIGVVVAARLLRLGAMTRVPGCELMPEICRLAAAGGYGVFLYGSKPETVTQVATLLQNLYPRLSVVGTQHGYVPEERMGEVIDRINSSKADVLFVALGSPKQELWIDQYRDRLDVRICQGVGGTFDVICGNPVRAPLVFRKLNLEWFHRLATQPQRIRRQRALPKFTAQLVRELLLRRAH